MAILETDTSHTGNRKIVVTTDAVSGMRIKVEEFMMEECTDGRCIRWRNRYEEITSTKHPPHYPDAGTQHPYEADGDMGCYE